MKCVLAERNKYRVFHIHICVYVDSYIRCINHRTAAKEANAFVRAHTHTLTYAHTHTRSHAHTHVHAVVYAVFVNSLSYDVGR